MKLTVLKHIKSFFVSLLLLGVNSYKDLKPSHREGLSDRIRSLIFSDQRIGVIGGQSADIGDFPSLVSIQSLRGEHFCAGNVIDANHVLTVAHCVSFPSGNLLNKSTFHLVGGDTEVSYSAPNRRVYRTVSHIFVHPNHNGIMHINDVAVLRVTHPFPLIRGLVEPINLAKNPPVDGESCSVAGWGTTDPQKPLMPNKLQRIEIMVQNIKECNRTYDGLIRDGMICAGVPAGGKDACQGDSGGGMICKGALTGIVAFGKGCALPGIPGVYTDVHVYADWIKQTTVFEGTQEQIPNPNYSQDSTINNIMEKVWTIIHSRSI